MGTKKLIKGAENANDNEENRRKVARHLLLKSGGVNTPIYIYESVTVAFVVEKSIFYQLRSVDFITRQAVVGNQFGHCF